MDDQWGCPIGGQVVADASQHVLPANEMGRAFLGEVAVSVDLLVEGIAGLKLADLFEDHPTEIGFYALAQAGESVLCYALTSPGDAVVVDVLVGEVSTQARRQVAQTRLGFGVWTAVVTQVEEVAGAAVRGQAVDGAEVAEGVVGAGLEGAFDDLLLGGRALVLDARGFRQVHPVHGPQQDAAQASFRCGPRSAVLVPGAVLARLEDVLGRDGVVVTAIPTLAVVGLGVLPEQQAPFLDGDVLQDGLELVGWDVSWRGSPAVALAEQDDEVGARRDALAAADLFEADGHRLLVERRLLADAPAQVDGLEAAAVLHAQVPQLRPDMLLERIPLGFHVAEGRADKDAEGSAFGRHGLLSSRCAGVRCLASYMLCLGESTCWIGG